MTGFGVRIRLAKGRDLVARKLRRRRQARRCETILRSASLYNRRPLGALSQDAGGSSGSYPMQHHMALSAREDSEGGIRPETST